MKQLAIFLVTGSLVLNGCSQINKAAIDVGEAVVGTGSETGSIIPDKTYNITPSIAYPLEKMVFWGVYAAAAYLILDPFAPNWSIEEARFDDNLVHFNLKMKRYYAGGAGEARVVFHRRAKELMREGKFKRYEVLEYNESLESSVLGSQRVTQGVIRLL